MLFSRAAGDIGGAVVVALNAVAYAGVGWAARPGYTGAWGSACAAVHLLVATTAMLLATGAASVGAGDAGPVLLCAGASASPCSSRR